MACKRAPYPVYILSEIGCFGVCYFRGSGGGGGYLSLARSAVFLDFGLVFA